MNPCRRRLPFGPPFSPAVFKITRQFLLFGVHGDYRIAPRLLFARFLADLLKLRVAVRVIAALHAFGISLEAAAQFLQ